FTSEISGGNVSIRVNLSRTTEGPANRGIFPLFLASSASLPSQVHDFYNTEVNLSLYINGTFNQSKKVVVPVEGANADFALTLAPGSYNITVKSDVTDCKCNSSVIKEASQLVEISGAGGGGGGGGGGAVNYTLTVSVNPQGSGTVNVNDTTCISSVGCPAGTYVLLTAVPSANYSFANWSGDASGTSNPLTIIMDSNKSITANFVATGGGGGGGAGQGCDCPTPSEWSECRLNASGGFSQNRTNYRCDESTGFSCVAFVEIRGCTPGIGMPGMPGCDADGSCVLGCASGDPDCNCSSQGGRICAGNLTCPVGYGLRARQAGCCAAQCREYCAKEGAVEYCLPGSDRCALMRRCINHSWSDCVKIDPGCITGNACDDGTPSGFCSLRQPGLFCANGSLVFNESCRGYVTIPEVPSLGTENLIVKLEIPERLKKFFKISGIALIAIVLLIGLAYFIMKRASRAEAKAIEAEELLMPVKPSELLLSIIESLSPNEKRVCEILINGNGIRQELLREESGLTKQQLEKALTSLEEKQIIKPRSSEPNPRIWFNENLL
ncbi:MAG: hypothetical protein QXJ34_02145, partial [Candidatus Pacearchaeota archaeon]